MQRMVTQQKLERPKISGLRSYGKSSDLFFAANGNFEVSSLGGTNVPPISYAVVCRNLYIGSKQTGRGMPEFAEVEAV